ncbi:ABC transporter permease [Rarobacter faecitabidus]|uniref:Nucleoside ABC transporter membrane protein n=1 Tax=Rarobacter faecitabidus TaxID=13243 RepID=A0A542ZV65_RARFA|nr:ABC transporter permease [Rarobacter faecitabidus]TQL64199.1 nucleoside ABC transporter membrane protein [Rarobacter faecitabidus]
MSEEKGKDEAIPVAPEADKPESRFKVAWQDIVRGSALVSVLAVVAALLIGAILIAAINPEVQRTAGYLFARPQDFLKAVWDAVVNGYLALFQSAFYNSKRDTFSAAIRPFTDTLTYATPLIAAGLGVGLAFRAGLFNIGGRGQMIVGAACAAWVGFTFDLPVGIHLIIAIAAGIAGGALWGGVAGFLKARTGAHEVILTIMLNYIAYYLVSWMLRTPGLLQAPGSVNPKSPPMKETAVLPPLLGSQFSLHWGFVLVIGATVLIWWLINRSALGFEFRAVGFNPDAARTAGINVRRMYVVTMLIAGALVGLAGANQVLSTQSGGLTSGVDAGIGFDAITVALLGRSSPWGIFAAGILFGAFKAGGFGMQAAEGIPAEIVTIVQSVIVLFIAAPPLVRAMFFLPGRQRAKRKEKLSVTQGAAS